MEIKIICHDWLSPGTIILSKDLYELLRRNYLTEELDKVFLKSLGITEDNQ